MSKARLDDLISRTDSLGEDELEEAINFARRRGLPEAGLALVQRAAGLPHLAPELLDLACRIAANPELTVSVYEAILAHDAPTPDVKDGGARDSWLRAANNALIALQLQKRYPDAAALTDRVRPHLAENPHLCHSGACCYVAVGRLDDGFALCKLAVELDYPHLDALRDNHDLDLLRGRADFQALFPSADLPATPGWAAPMTPDEYQRFRDLVRAELEGRRILASYSAFDTGAVHIGGAHFGLQGLRRKCSLSPASTWPAIAHEHFGALLAAAPSDAQALRDALKLRLYNAEEMGGLALVHRPFAPGLVLALFLDLPERTESVGEEVRRRLALGEDRLFELAREHIDAEPRLAQAEIEGLHPAVKVFVGDSFFSASHALRLDEYIEPAAALLVAVPTRHVLIVAPLTGEAAVVLDHIVRLAYQLHDGEAGRLTPHPYLVVGNDWQRIASGVRDDGQVWVAPPEAFLAAMERAGRAS